MASTKAKNLDAAQILTPAVLLRHSAAFPRGTALAFGASEQLVMFRDAFGWAVSVDACVGMDVRAAVEPGSAPPRVVDEHGVPSPVKAAEARSPTPRPEEYSERHAKPEADCAADKEAGPRSEENDARVIVRHHNEVRVYRHDGDVRSAANDNLSVRSQISEIAGLASLPLNGVHHIGLLGQESVSEIGRPVHIAGHHFQHGWKRQQRLNAGIPRKLISLNRVGQGLSGEVMMLIGPLRRVRNLVGIGGARENLRHKRIGIKRDARNKPVDLGWRARWRGRGILILSKHGNSS